MVDPGRNHTVTMILRRLVSEDIQRTIHGYFIDLCLLDHREKFIECLREIVFLNPERMMEIKAECLDAATTGDHETLRKYLGFGHRFYMDPFNVENNLLEISIMCNNYRCVEVILEYTRSHREIELCGGGPLVSSLVSENLDILRLLLEKGFNPWGADNVSVIHIIEWGSMYDALQVYIECGISFSAAYLLKTGCTNVLGYLMGRGYDPTEELVRRGKGYDWWGSRARLFKLIYVSCLEIDQYNRCMLSRMMDHDEVENGGGLLQFDYNNRELRVLLDMLRDSGDHKYDFLWAQE